MNQNETSRNGKTSPLKPKKDILLPTVIALIGVMAAVLILGASGLIQSGGSASSSPSSGGAVSLTSAAASEGYAISSGEAVAGGSGSAQSAVSAPSSDLEASSSAVQSGSSAAPQAPAGSGGASGAGTVQRTETTGSAVSQATPQMQPFSPQDGSADASSGEAPSPDSSSGSAVSRQEFDALTQGMTYDDVVAAVGGPGTPSDSSFGNNKTYQWDGYGSSGAWVKITFKGGRLTYKYQFGL